MFCSLSRTSTPSLCVVVPSRDVSVVVASKFKIAFHLGVWSTACCGGSLKYRTFWFYLVFNWSILGVCSTSVEGFCSIELPGSTWSLVLVVCSTSVEVRIT